MLWIKQKRKKIQERILEAVQNEGNINAHRHSKDISKDRAKKDKDKEPEGKQVINTDKQADSSGCNCNTNMEFPYSVDTQCLKQ